MGEIRTEIWVNFGLGLAKTVCATSPIRKSCGKISNDSQTFLKKSLKRYTCIYVPSCQRVRKVTSP